MRTMRAAVLWKHGGYDAIRIEQIKAPPLETADEVLVQVKACALNRLDLFMRTGFSVASLPHVPGVDVAGEVVEVGSGLTDWQVGDRVVIYPALTCGRCERCRQGEET